LQSFIIQKLSPARLYRNQLPFEWYRYIGRGTTPSLWNLGSKWPTPSWTQQWRHGTTSLHLAHWLASSLKLAARCPVSWCWPSCYVLSKLSKRQQI